MCQNYKSIYRIVVCVLLLSLFLQSCDSSNQLILSVKEATEDTRGVSKKRKNTKQLMEQKLTSVGAELTDLYEKDDELKVRAKEKLGNFISKPQDLAVHIASDRDLEEVSCLSSKGQERMVHLNKPGRLYIDKQELLGEMERDSRGKKEAEEKGNDQEKEVVEESSREEIIRLSNFAELPIELWQIVVSYLGYPDILNCRSVNRSFYEFITGYSQIGVVGIENKPNEIFYSANWSSDKPIDFKSKKFSVLTTGTMPGFFFYRLMGQVKNLPQPFWSYIGGTRFHALNLSWTRIRVTSLNFHVFFRTT